jgi:hypothetical protein
MSFPFPIEHRNWKHPMAIVVAIAGRCVSCEASF